MVGFNLYARRKRVYAFLLAYAGLFIAGLILALRSLSRNENPPYTSGFLLIFGAGMFLTTLVKSRTPQVAVQEDFLALKQSRTTQLVRYRNILSVSRPDKSRLIVTLLEDGSRKNITVYLKELEPTEVEKLADFLTKKSLKK